MEEGQDAKTMWAVLDQQELLPLGICSASTSVVGQSFKTESSTRNKARQQQQLVLLEAA